jgi:hypothetical protein
MPLSIPIATEPSQELRVTLGGQLCRVRLYVREILVPVARAGSIVTDPPVYEAALPTFLDLYVDDVLVVGGVLCRDRTLLVRDAYLGLSGDLSFYDEFGSEDPTYQGLGKRFLLLYWTAEELP